MPRDEAKFLKLLAELLQWIEKQKAAGTPPSDEMIADLMRGIEEQSFVAEKPSAAEKPAAAEPPAAGKPAAAKPPAEEKPTEKKPVEKSIPAPVETRDLGMVYDSVRDKWTPAYQSVFRQSPDAAVISVSTIARHVIIPGVANADIRIISICFTVAGEVNVTLYDGDVAISGPMDFGGTGEPRGIVITYSYAPLGLHIGRAFKIQLSANVLVAGSVCYFYS